MKQEIIREFVMNRADVANPGRFLPVSRDVDYAEVDQDVCGRIGALRVPACALRQADAGWQMKRARWTLRGEFGNGALP
jgi:hypothetical protein